MVKIDLEKFICSFLEHRKTDNGNICGIIQLALKDQGLEYKEGQIVEIKHQSMTVPKEVEKDYRSIDPHFYKSIDLPFGAYDSELIANEWTIPGGYTAEVKDDKVVIKKAEVKPFKIKAGQWYKCIADGLMFFKLNHLYYCSKDGYLDQWGKDATEKPIYINGDSLANFRPATEDEIPHEPKFKAGDFTASYTNLIRRIIKVENGYYTTDYGILPIEDYDSVFHLWSIYDAKDGDVLATTHENGHGLIIFIFKRIVNDEMFCHCLYDSSMSEKLCFDACVDSDYIGNANGAEEEFHPATQEQRDLLFQKMAEAGYKWDAEKKELRKIQKPDLDNTNGTNTIKFEESEEGLTGFELGMLTFLQDAQNEFSEKDVDYFLKKHSPHLLSLTRKQIAKEVDVNCMVNSFAKEKTSNEMMIFEIYRQGILDTLEKIKEGE